MNRVKHGHYVSQGYLRAFADPARKKPTQIFQLRREDLSRVHSNAINKVATNRGFYDVGPGDTVQEVEDWFSQEVEGSLPFDLLAFIEASLKPWYRRLPPAPLDRVLMHMTVQYLRIPYVRDLLKKQLADRALAPGGEAWRLAEEMRTNSGVLNVRLEAIEVHVNGPAHMALVLHDANLNGMMEDLRTFTWQLRTTDPDHPFVTSDAPVVIVPPPNATAGIRGFPHDCRAIYPLTPTALLYGHKSGKSLKAMSGSAVLHEPPARVTDLNRLMFLGHQRELLGSSPAALRAAVPPEIA